jgi:DNA-binding GntR family transcriptional regulator
VSSIVEPVPDDRGSGRETLAERAYRAIEELIVTLQLEPGAAVSETELSARLAIGRTPIREALQRLAAEQLVVVMPRRAVVVSDVTIERQLLLLDVRRELERLIATRAARLAGKDERERFARMADEMEASVERQDDVTFLRIDRAFNDLVASAGRNPFARRAIAPLHVESRRFFFIHHERFADMAEVARLHGAVMRAIAARDPAAASDASDALLDHMAAFTRSTLGGERRDHSG